MPRTPFPPTVHTHQWEGFAYCSRLTRSASPRLDPVVLVGGALHRKEDWGRLEQAILEGADVICPDLPGWGQADLLPSHYGPELPAEALRQLLDDLGIERVNLFAGSYGSAVGYRLAQDHPERIARMVLAGTMRAIPEPVRPAMRAVLDLAVSGERERFGPTAVETLMCPDPLADIAAAGVVRRILTMRFGNAGAEEIPKFVANTRRLLEHDLIDLSRPQTIPTLFTTGEHDTFTTPEACRELALTCRESWFVEMSRADHLIHLERPAQLADLMVRFFAGEALADLPYANTIEDLRRVPVPA